MAKKTNLMLRVEQREGQDLEQLLPPLLTELGLTDTARALGMNEATISYWMLKLGIKLQRVAMFPGETIEIRKVMEQPCPGLRATRA